jgi:hypothetical protein
LPDRRNLLCKGNSRLNPFSTYQIRRQLKQLHELFSSIPLFLLQPLHAARKVNLRLSSIPTWLMPPLNTLRVPWQWQISVHLSTSICLLQ